MVDIMQTVAILIAIMVIIIHLNDYHGGWEG